MLGRGALADPLLAHRIRHWQCTGERLPGTSWQTRAEILNAYAALQRITLPERVVVSLLKQWLNHMRARDKQAGQRFMQLRRVTNLDSFLKGLTAVMDTA